MQLRESIAVEPRLEGCQANVMGLVLSSLWTTLFGGQREVKVVMVGLGNAGKTTVLYKLHLGEVVSTQPTIGSNVEEIKHGKVNFQCWDLGGQSVFAASASGG